jgi:hypothetical protein
MTAWASLILSSASLVIALLTFYRVEMRGPDISVVAPLDPRQRARPAHGTWPGGLPQPHTVACRLLFVNEGPRAGLVEALRFEPVAFLPHPPRILRASLSQLHDGQGRAVVMPVVIRDGEVEPKSVTLEFGVSTTQAGALMDLDHDLRELTAARITYSYTTWRRTFLGRLQLCHRRGHVEIDLALVRDQARSIWAASADYRDALAVIDGRG